MQAVSRRRFLQTGVGGLAGLAGCVSGAPDPGSPLDGTVRRRLALELDGTPVSLARRQPVAWRHDTVDVAFAASKTATFDRGAVTYGGTELRSLSESAVGD